MEEINFSITSVITNMNRSVQASAIKMDFWNLKNEGLNSHNYTFRSVGWIT